MRDLRHSQGCPGESVREDEVSDGRIEPEKEEAQVLVTCVGVQHATKNEIATV